MSERYITSAHSKLLRVSMVIEAFHILVFWAIPLFGLIGFMQAEGSQADGYVLILTLSIPLVLLSIALLVLLTINYWNYRRLIKGKVSKTKAQDIYTYHLIYGISACFLFALFLIGILYIISYTRSKKSLNP